MYSQLLCRRRSGEWMVKHFTVESDELDVWIRSTLEATDIGHDCFLECQPRRWSDSRWQRSSRVTSAKVIVGQSPAGVISWQLERQLSASSCAQDGSWHMLPHQCSYSIICCLPAQAEQVRIGSVFSKTSVHCACCYDSIEWCF